MKEGVIRTVLVLLAFSLGVGVASYFPSQSRQDDQFGKGEEEKNESSIRAQEISTTMVLSDSGAPPLDVSFNDLTPIAKGEPIAMIGESVKMQSTSGKLEYLALLQKLTPEDAPRLLDLFRELSLRGYRVSAYDRLFWERWAEIDGSAACETMFVRDRRFKETNLSKLAIATWAKNDPDAAREWLFNQENIPLRDGMTKGLLEGMAERDPAATQRFLESAELPLKQVAHGYAQIARQTQIQGGLESVGAWYATFSESDPAYEMVTNATAQIYARSPFGDALAWADSLTGSPESVSGTRGQLHARLAYGRPDGLLTFLANDQGAATLAGVGSLAEKAVSRWIGTNPNAMGKWLRDNSDIANYDLVAAPFIEQIASQDFEAARVWADTIRNAELRNALKDRLIQKAKSTIPVN